MTARSIILVVDDNRDIRDLLQLILEKEGYMVKRAKNAENALKKAEEYTPHLILLDMMMPNKDGITLCKELRALLGQRPRIVFLTARDEEYSEVAGFEAGADDFIIKPIKAQALVRRVEALLKRDQQKSPPPARLEVEDWLIDANQHLIKHKGREIRLRKKEFDILYFLAQHPEQFFLRDELIRQVWGEGSYITARTVDVHIRRIRQEVGSAHILTRKGLGYAFKV